MAFVPVSVSFIVMYVKCGTMHFFLFVYHLAVIFFLIVTLRYIKVLNQFKFVLLERVVWSSPFLYFKYFSC